MPRVHLTETERTTSRIKRMILGQIDMKGVKQKDIADIWECSQPGAGYKVKNMAIDPVELVSLVNYLEFDDKEILEMFGRK